MEQPVENTTAERSRAQLRLAAEEVLRANDVGAYTMPARGLYPHQWNWDSAFISLGWAALDPGRAYLELETLLGSQDEDGLVPHVAFSDEAAAVYMPGPGWWHGHRGRDGRAISQITQPPVAASCLRLLHQRHPDRARTRALLAPLARWHRFLLSERDPTGLGQPVLIHPWESGRDNAVEWDPPLGGLERPMRDFERQDILHVPAAERPVQEHYSAFLSLIELFARSGFDQRMAAASGSFRALDPGFSSILARACLDLGELAEELGEPELAAEARRQSERVSDSVIDRLWDHFPVASDCAGARELPALGAGSALGLLCPSLPARSVRRMRDEFLHGRLASAFGVRSLASDHPEASSRRYWRGPVWANLTWLCARGLELHGEHEAASELRGGMLDAVSAGGMHEYFSPETGQGHGAARFSWTAALCLWELSL